MKIQMFEVGGVVRDDLLGIPSNDVDFVVVGTDFEGMIAHVRSAGLAPIPGTFKPEFATIKAAVPKNHPLRERCKSADFVLARKDGPSSDGRRPDFVEQGTLLDDLKRRDFTVNAIARNNETGELFDPFDGVDDIKSRILRFVGEPIDRIREDGLRVLRALRFAVTKGFIIIQREALNSDVSAKMLASVSVERKREELEKMFKIDTLASLAILEEFPAIRFAIFNDSRLRLSATLKK